MTNTGKTFLTSNFCTFWNYKLHSPNVQKNIKISVLVLSQLSMEIYELTLATQKLATFNLIIQVLDRKLAD